VSFKDASFASRYGSMGDEAEARFDELFPRHHKLGLNRPNLHVASLPVEFRYTPDRMVQHALVEVQGVGQDQRIKLKIEKMTSLLKWETLGPLEMFVWDSSQKRWTIGPFDLWVDAFFQFGDYDTFDNGTKPYLGLPCADVPYEWRAA
jgi:hypothetical protein